MNAQEIAELWEPLAEKIGKGLSLEPLREWYVHDHQDDAVPDDIAATLWRDHAVRWLANHAADATGGNVRIYWNGQSASVEPDDAPDEYVGPTLDHALAAACRAAGLWFDYW